MLTLSASCASVNARRTALADFDTDVAITGPDVRGHFYFWNKETKRMELSADEVQLPEGLAVTRYNGPLK